MSIDSNSEVLVTQQKYELLEAVPDRCSGCSIAKVAAYDVALLAVSNTTSIEAVKQGFSEIFIICPGASEPDPCGGDGTKRSCNHPTHRANKALTEEFTL